MRSLLRYSRQRRRPRHDVVFYSPWIGWILSANAPHPPGGAETQVLMLAKELARRNLRVAIVAFGTAEDLPRVVDGVTILPRPSYISGRRFVGKFIETFHIWRSLWAAPSDVVVFRTAGVMLGLIGLFTKLTGRRLVFSSANISDFDLDAMLRDVVHGNRRDLIIYRLGVRLANDIVVQTEEQVALCRSAFARTPKVIKSLEPLAQPRSPIPEAFLWVGRLVNYKQPLPYLELARAIPEAQFWMVGVPVSNFPVDRELAEDVTRQANDISNLDLLPPRRHADLQALMDRAVASVNTAQFEGMPNVLLEAWTRGIPALVLTHDPGGVVTRYGLGGFADGSHEQLVALARDLWQNRADRSALSERCRGYIESHHSPAVIARRWHSVLLGASADAADPAFISPESTYAVEGKL